MEMNILVVNCGSSSLKFQLVDSETEQVKASGNCERIGFDGKIVYKIRRQSQQFCSATEYCSMQVSLILALHGAVLCFFFFYFFKFISSFLRCQSQNKIINDH